ncbi:hypothetical protein V1525DRAFT_335175 [Lipomyces kononenkoae]|uniref:Uncharacterized protein n=1 Tax=Lipomyces kononenkoae TaxID=34357 RepID=A0ACC3TBW5_LIPKO
MASHPVAVADPDRSKVLLQALSSVSSRVAAASAAVVALDDQSKSNPRPPRLVAVSKVKPASDIQILYEHAGHRHFGENYVQELVDKAGQLPQDIQWHFIGSLQSNKCATLAAIPNLFAVETVDAVKKARKLNDARNEDWQKLNVFIQVNTSGEHSKSGLAPGQDTVDVARYIVNECGRLNLLGLMTIGSIARSNAAADGEQNEDFTTLVKTKYLVESELGMNGLELSMGMSQDFEDAIKQGSTNVRVGSEIFGARPPRKTAD